MTEFKLRGGTEDTNPASLAWASLEERLQLASRPSWSYHDQVVLTRDVESMIRVLEENYRLDFCYTVFEQIGQYCRRKSIPLRDMLPTGFPLSIRGQRGVVFYDQLDWAAYFVSPIIGLIGGAMASGRMVKYVTDSPNAVSLVAAVGGVVGAAVAFAAFTPIMDALLQKALKKDQEANFLFENDCLDYIQKVVSEGGRSP